MNDFSKRVAVTSAIPEPQHSHIYSQEHSSMTTSLIQIPGNEATTKKFFTFCECNTNSLKSYPGPAILDKL